MNSSLCVSLTSNLQENDHVSVKISWSEIIPRSAKVSGDRAMLAGCGWYVLNDVCVNVCVCAANGLLQGGMVTVCAVCCLC